MVLSSRYGNTVSESSCDLPRVTKAGRGQWQGQKPDLLTARPFSWTLQLLPVLGPGPEGEVLEVWGKRDPGLFRRETTSQLPKTNYAVNSTSLSLADQRKGSSGKTNPGSWEPLQDECEILTKCAQLGGFATVSEGGRPTADAS